MDMNHWKQYQNQTENDIVQSLLSEEVDQQCRGREQIRFRCVAKKRIRTSLFWGIPTLALLLRYLLTNSLNRGPSGVLPVIAVALIWLIRVCKVSNQNAVRYLALKAAKSPDTPFSQIVAEDIQDKESGFLGSKMVHALLCLAVILGSLAIPITDRLSEMHVDGMIFKPYQNGCILVDCEADFSTADGVIPEQVQGKTVVAIDSGAFMNERNLISIRIPDTVTSIGAEAFSGCTRLKSVVIPRGVTEIRGNCFEDCESLQNVTLHDGITTIHGYAFRNCSYLKTIILPAGITEIRGYCFENCTNLESIQIPEGVTRIGAHAFMGCRALENVTVPSTVREIGSSAFRKCPSLHTIRIPGEATVDERSFKESPTEVIRFWFTEEQEAAIDEELANREAEVLYFAYESAKGMDSVWFCSGNDTVLIVDDSRYAERLGSRTDLAPLEDYADVLNYLKKAREQGAKTVAYILYSQVATDIKGKTWFVSYSLPIENLIAQAEAKLAEG